MKLLTVSSLLRGCYLEIKYLLFFLVRFQLNMALYRREVMRTMFESCGPVSRSFGPVPGSFGPVLGHADHVWVMRTAFGSSGPGPVEFNKVL